MDEDIIKEAIAAEVRNEYALNAVIVVIRLSGTKNRYESYTAAIRIKLFGSSIMAVGPRAYSIEEAIGEFHTFFKILTVPQKRATKIYRIVEEY